MTTSIQAHMDRPATSRTILFVVVALAWLWPLTTPIQPVADSVGYAAPAVSLVSDGDLLYLDEYSELRMGDRFFRPTPTGLVGNHWSIGLGLALTPTYALGRLLWPSDGALGQRALVAMHATSLLWLGLLLWGMFRLAHRGERLEGEGTGGEAGPRWIPALVAAALYLGSGLFYYAHATPLMPHLLEATLATLLVLVALRSREAPSLESALALGALAGALVLVRPQAAVIAVLPLGDGIARLRAAWREGRESFGRAVRPALLRLSGALLPVAGALAVGRWVSRLLYGPDAGPGLWRAVLDVHVDLVNSLVHPHHGLLTWAPVVAPALAGLLLLLRRDRRLILPVMVILLVQLWLNGTSFEARVDEYQYTRHWAGGASFGGRRWLCCLPLFALGLAELFRRVRARPARLVLSAGICLATLWSLSLAAYGRIHPAEVFEDRVLSWDDLFELQAAALAALPDTLSRWVAAVPAPGTSLGAWAVATVHAAVLALGVVAARRLGARSRTWVLAGALAALFVVAPVGLGAIGARTRRAAESQAAELARFRQHAEDRTDSVQYGWLVEVARLHAGTGRGRLALERYEEAFRIGLGSRSVERYLELSLELEGRDAARRRLDELRARYPGHPALTR